MSDPGASLISVPPGYGFRRVRLEELKARKTSDPRRLFDLLLIWEPPRRTRSARYILGVDVGDGVGADRTVCDVLRVGTIEEPAEQVAQFVSDRLPPSKFAYVVAAIGHLYADPDGLEAQAVIETNNHGLSLQDTLQNHLHYKHFYRWEFFDAADPSKRFSTHLGWKTTVATRPLLIDKLYEGITTVDALTGLADLRLNSTMTIDEMWSLYTLGSVGEAEAGKGAHDDCLIAVAIAYYVSWKLASGEQEPLADRRRRKHEAYAAAQQALVDSGGSPVRAAVPDWRNSAVTADEMSAAFEDGDEGDYGPTFHTD